ncbi:hypothetical protein [Cellulophaga algicola]|uniref:hypothetical protein n=1 Tax=Cellulophaga algicola TaxID=59600 RepID=UPI00069344AB|nr:hypothetical protein [Cellulophaga algicola]
MASTTVEGSYEYYLNEDTSVGGTLYFDSTPLNYNGNFGIGPNFRAYFGYAPRSGFFAEAFGLYYPGEIKDSEITNTTLDHTYSNWPRYRPQICNLQSEVYLRVQCGFRPECEPSRIPEHFYVQSRTFYWVQVLISYDFTTQTFKFLNLFLT